MARIAAIVTNGCNPDPRVIRQSRWLVDLGHQVIIHAFDRLENLSESEHIDGVEIIRHRVGKVPYGGTWKTWLGIRRFLRSVFNSLEEIDLIYCHDADTLPLTRMKTGVKFIFDMHDLQHTWVRMPAPNSLLRKLASYRMKSSMLRMASSADEIITSSQGFSDWLKERGLDSTPIENRPMNKKNLDFPTNRGIGYFGKIRDRTSFKLLFDAVELIPENDRPRIIIAGDGTKVESVKKLAKKYSSHQIEFTGRFDHTELPSLMSKINLMFAMYSPKRGNIGDGALPSKMFEAAAYGRPSIVNANTPMGELCEAENLGASVQWNDAQELADAIMKLEGKVTDLEIDEKREKKRFFETIAKLRI